MLQSTTNDGILDRIGHRLEACVCVTTR